MPRAQGRPALSPPVRALLIAALVLVVLLIVYTVATDPSWKNKSYWLSQRADRRDPADAAEGRRQRPRTGGAVADHLHAATAITRDILDQEHRPEIDRRTGAPTRAARDRARFRRGMYDQARGHFLAAVGTPGAPALPTAIPAWNRPAVREAINAAQGAVDAALGFAFEGWGAMLTGDQIMAALIAAGELPGFEFAGGDDWFVVVDAPLAGAAAARQEDLLEARQRMAREIAETQGGTRGAAAATYVDLATQHTNDPQNAHDTGVLACLRSVVARLRADQGDLGQIPPLARVADDIRVNGREYSENRPNLVSDALGVVTRAGAGERVVALGHVTDEECLRRVWARADDARNGAVRRAMRQSLFDNLVDCWEGTGDDRTIVCVNGRASRILSALVLLDWDKRNWTVKKLEQFKNDIFERAGRVIHDTARRAADSGDPAGRLFLASTPDEVAAVGAVPPEAEARLADLMREGIDQMVDAYIADLENEAGLVGVIPDYMVAKTKREAKAAIL